MRALLVWVTFLCAVGSASCSASRLTLVRPTGVVPDSGARSMVVAVDRAGLPEPLHDKDRFVRALRQSDLFQAVRHLDEPGAEPDLLVTSVTETPALDQMIRRGFQCFEPYLFIATLGVIPVVCHIDHELRVLVTTPDRVQSTELSLTYTVRAVGGWAAILVRMSPHWEAPSDEVNAQQLGRILRDGLGPQLDRLIALRRN